MRDKTTIFIKKRPIYVPKSFFGRLARKLPKTNDINKRGGEKFASACNATNKINAMNKWNRVLAVAAVAALCLGANSLMAQGRNRGGGGGNFDPAQMRQRMMDNYKERLEITDDSEWNVIQPAIGKVIDARDALRSSEFGGGFGRGGNRGNRGGGTNSTDQTTQDNTNNNNNNNNRRGNRGGPGGGGPTASPEVQALQAALDAKAPADEIKDKLSKVRDSVKANEAKLAAAQADLQKLLSSRQEATAVLLGLLK